MIRIIHHPSKTVACLLACILFLVTGCEQAPKELSEPERWVTVNFSVGCMLKSDAAQDETLITKIMLFGVNDQNLVEEIFPLIVNPSLHGVSLAVPQTVTSLYAIANPSAALEKANPANVSDLLDLTEDFSTAPQTPLLMSGTGNISGNAVQIKLIRALAKVGFVSENDFQITSVTVTNTSSKGFVFPATASSVPASAEGVTYSFTDSHPFIYLAENSSQDPASLLVTGLCKGNMTAYGFVISFEGKPVDVVRNTSYQICIKPKTP